MTERPVPEGSEPKEEEVMQKTAQGTKEEDSTLKKGKRKKKKCSKDGVDSAIEEPSESNINVGLVEEKDGKTKTNTELKKTQEEEGPETENLKGDSKKNQDELVLKDGARNKDDTPNEEDEDDGSEDDELLLLEKPDLETRNKLYNHGMKLFHKRKRSRALRYFLTCITGVLETGEFQFFPQCLKKIAEIYYSQENYEKAIQFIQAEKLFYETALINRSGLQTKQNNLEGGSPGDGEIAPEGQSNAGPEELRAEEYENLAKLCLNKKQPELALEYQGKATQIRQQHLGNDHPLTKKSLDFFTVVYAEVGKREYSDTLNKTMVKRPGGDTASEGGILRKRKSPEKKDDGNRHVRFQEPEREDQESRLVGALLLGLFLLCLCVLLGVLGYLYCRLDVTCRHCATWRSYLHFYYMKVKYFYYTWNAHPQFKFG